MLNKVTQFALVATSLAPILLTRWFFKFSKAWQWKEDWDYQFTAVGLGLLCLVLIRLTVSPQWQKEMVT
ncbi:MAG: hypothetical protein LC540_16210 [Candidatus Thiodiazotropha sp.]|nr:hypothetical protein [Candidatus Thiodiazotropha sp.]